MIAPIRNLLAAGSTAAALLLIGTPPATAGDQVPRDWSQFGVESIYRDGHPATLKRAMRYLEEKKDERAARAAERALRLDLTRAQREMMLHVGCVSRLRLGQLEGAFAYCDAAVEAGGPRHWAHLVNRGNVHLENGDQQAALADFEAASLWLAENEVAGEPAERVRVAMQWAQPAPPASQLAVEDSPR